MEKLKKGSKGKPKTKFQEFLEMETTKGPGSAEEDLEMERRLAKRLKVKGKKLGGPDDGISALFEGIPSVLDSVPNDSIIGDETGAKQESTLRVSSSSRKPQRRRNSSRISAADGSLQAPARETGVAEQIDIPNEEDPSAEASELGAKKVSKRKSKTKFQEFLEMETSKGAAGAEEELETERRLAKKLKVSGGKLGGLDDGIGELLEGTPSVLDSVLNDSTMDDKVAAKEESTPHVSSRRKRRRKPSRTSTEQLDHEVIADASPGVLAPESGTPEQHDGSDDEGPRAEAPTLGVRVKYVAPHLRACVGGESEELLQVRRRVRGLLNRLSESNVESITEEMAVVFRSIGRSVGCQIIGQGVVSACSEGPRGNEQYAAVFASFVAGMACLVGVDFSAKLIASVAKSFEDEFLKEDSLSLRNLTLLLSYLSIFGVCSSDLIYDLLSVLSKRLTEMDVSTILTILQCCGMKLRSDDPTAMKDFVLGIQNRVNEVKSLSESNTQEPKINSRRMEFMLETILDIKNNKKKTKEDPVHYTRLKKWLQKLRAEDVLLRGLTWSKLLDTRKKGQWWLSGEISSAPGNIEEVATTINREVVEAQKLVQLAAAQRMNTDIRRAIFCIIMSAEDYVDAFEKILRLDLTGKQDREIVRVLMECCLQEKVFNKYYTVLASKLCTHDKNHKFTLQYCIWDHFKELELMELTRSMKLARFVAEMLSAFTLSLALLKTVDLTDPAQLTPKRIMHFRMLFESIFENAEAVVWNIFTRVAAIPELEMLRDGLRFFIKQYVVAASPGKSVAGKFTVAKKALDNVAGVLM